MQLQNLINDSALYLVKRLSLIPHKKEPLHSISKKNLVTAAILRLISLKLAPPVTAPDFARFSKSSFILSLKKLRDEVAAFA